MWLKMILSLSLSGMLVLQPLLPWIEYALFKRYIIENLCVNRDKPDSCCQGKCFLQKQIKEVSGNEKNDKEAPPPSKIKLSLYTIPMSVNGSIDRPEMKTRNFHSAIIYSFLFISNIFHPPRF